MLYIYCVLIYMMLSHLSQSTPYILTESSQRLSEEHATIILILQDKNRGRKALDICPGAHTLRGKGRAGPPAQVLTTVPYFLAFFLTHIFLPTLIFPNFDVLDNVVLNEEIN